MMLGCCGEENCPDREVLTKADGYVLRSSVLSSIHNGDIDMGMVTPHEYRLLQKLSRGIDRRIQRVPVSDVAPVRHGRWIPDYDYAEYDYDGSTRLPEPRKFQDGWQCSLCGQYMPSEVNYCPNCGADMREVDNEPDP